MKRVLKSPGKPSAFSNEKDLKGQKTGNSVKSAGLQAPGLLSQRYLGNAYLQSFPASEAVQPKPGKADNMPVIQRKCSCGGTCASCAGKEDDIKKIQPKLKVGPANDVYEREADRVAAQIMRMPEPVGQADSNTPPLGMQIQRLASPGFNTNINPRGNGVPLSVSTSQYHESPTKGLGKALNEQDDITDTEPDITFLFATTGETTCSFPAGVPSSKITNTNCSRPCTSLHETQHAMDIEECCKKAGEAYRAATTTRDEQNVRLRFFTWMGANRRYFECRAYGVSVSCADELIGTKNCKRTPAPGDAACCSHLISYRAKSERSRVNNCAGGPTLSTCPFP